MILVAEDKECVRQFIQTVLGRYGYQALMAKDGIEAETLWNEHKSGIRLLLTDVVMPGGVSGKDLADTLQSERPDLKVIFCSAYSTNIIGPEIINSPDGIYLAKPFDVERLIRIVEQALAVDEPNA